MNNGNELYLRLLKRCLTRDLFPDRQLDHDLVHTHTFDRGKRAQGLDWPTEADTMVGMRRLDNLESCIINVLRASVPGDLVEAGVWRGGCAIFMRAVLKAFEDRSRTVWLADSFQGLPIPNAAEYPADAGDTHSQFASYLAVSLDQVKENFRKYELLDDRVRFLPGWFRDTLPSAPMRQIAVLRLDGDMYESTIQALSCLYPKVSPGGFVIIDDYGALPNCRSAVDDFRAHLNIREPLIEIDWTGVYWRKLQPQAPV